MDVPVNIYQNKIKKKFRKCYKTITLLFWILFWIYVYIFRKNLKKLTFVTVGAIKLKFMSGCGMDSLPATTTVTLQFIPYPGGC